MILYVGYTVPVIMVKALLSCVHGTPLGVCTMTEWSTTKACLTSTDWLRFRQVLGGSRVREGDDGGGEMEGGGHRRE